MLQEEDLTPFDVAQSVVGEDEDMLSNYGDGLEVALCGSCGGTLACDAIALEEESAESGGGQEALLRVFRVCGLTSNQDRASLNGVGECIYSFFCYLQGGSQHLEEACMRSASSLKRLCVNCYTSRELKCHFSIHARECKTSTMTPRKRDEM
jgi:hypothetical protein